GFRAACLRACSKAIRTPRTGCAIILPPARARPRATCSPPAASCPDQSPGFTGTTRKSHLERAYDRHMIRWPLPAARLAQDLELLHAIGQRARGPDVVQPPSTIRLGPV